jgi:hypothetical protein
MAGIAAAARLKHAATRNRGNINLMFRWVEGGLVRGLKPASLSKCLQIVEEFVSDAA